MPEAQKTKKGSAAKILGNQLAIATLGAALLVSSSQIANAQQPSGRQKEPASVSRLEKFTSSPKFDKAGAAEKPSSQAGASSVKSAANSQHSAQKQSTAVAHPTLDGRGGLKIAHHDHSFFIGPKWGTEPEVEIFCDQFFVGAELNVAITDSIAQDIRNLTQLAANQGESLYCVPAPPYGPFQLPGVMALVEQPNGLVTETVTFIPLVDGRVLITTDRPQNDVVVFNQMYLIMNGPHCLHMAIDIRL